MAPDCPGEKSAGIHGVNCNLDANPSGMAVGSDNLLLHRVRFVGSAQPLMQPIRGMLHT